MNYNSEINMEIKKDFISKNVLVYFTSEMQKILSINDYVHGTHDLPIYKDIENLYLPKCEECGYQGWGFDYAPADNKGTGEFDDNHYVFICPECRIETEDRPEATVQKIYEWWIVTRQLYYKLKEKGKPVLSWGDNFYWGQTSGKPLHWEYVISLICFEMEILEGQKNDWSKK